MSMFSQLRERARSLFTRHRVDADLDEELRFHVERETEERVRRGQDPDTARRDALIALGGIEQRKEEVRDARGTRPLEDLAADVQYAVRALRRDPMFALSATLVLALGIGATSAVFGVADTVLFARLPYPEPDRIVRIFQAYSERNMFGLSMVDANAIAEQQRSFESFGVARPSTATVSANGEPEQRGVGRVTAGFFTVLRARAAVGRLLRPDDELPSADPVLVLSDASAIRLFGSAGNAVGKAMTIDGVPHTVVGVLPANVIDLAGMRPGVWITMKATPPARRGPFGNRGFARLKPGVTLDAATRDLAGISRRIFPIWKSSFRDSTTKLTPVELRTAILGRDSGRQVGLLGAGVGLVLLVAIVNVAMLMLVRVSARAPELALRQALGAGRWRIARLLSVESLLLALAAAIVGFMLAATLLGSAQTLLPSLPRIREVAASTRVAGIATVTAIIGALAALLPPLLTLLRRPLNTMVADRRAGQLRHSDRARSLLVAAEFGLALPLLFGAALLLNSFMRLQRVNPGYDPNGVVAVEIGLPLARYPQPPDAMRLWTALEQRMRESPMFASVGISTEVPPFEIGDINNFDLKDKPVPPGGVEHVAPWVNVTNGYFEALGIPLLEGRLFLPSDTVADTAGVPVTVVSRAWAKKYYPDESAVGKQLISGGCTTCPLTTVVGVVGDVKYLGLAQSADGVYVPIAQAVPSSANIVARVRGSSASPAAFRETRRIVSSLDPQLAVVETTLRNEVDRALADPRRWASILGAFALSTVVLATVGIFGLMAYTVRQRRREIGVRIALGAQQSEVVGMIVGRGMRYALGGSLAGIAIALVGSRWIRAFLFGVGTTDPVTLAAVTLVLLSVATLACWLAARRASRIHPVEAIASN